MNKILFCLLCLMLLPLTVIAQDEVLLTIDNQPVLRSEFERIYRKNNSVQGYESKSVTEYLDMFINFKIKVHEAVKLGYDTLASFRSELAGYREQLAKPYLQDKKLVDRLVQEAYFRTLNEVNASHIMVKLPTNAAPADTLLAYNKALEIRKRLLAGESFEKIARAESDDPSGKVNGGQLGWFSAFAMVFPFENAAYHTEVGEYSLPVRSRYGYHIILVNAKRPALGEIKLAHIMIRAGRNDDQATITRAKEKIDTCYQLLKSGISFANVVKQYSEDAGSANTGGQMRWLRSGELPTYIEDKVYALSDSGNFTIPLQSDFGWHIFQLQGRQPLSSFDKLKTQLEERILVDERGKLVEDSFIENLKKEVGFLDYPENISALATFMDSAVYSGNWEPVVTGDLIEPVFSMGNREYSQRELANYIVQTKRYSRQTSFADIVNSKYDEFMHKMLIEFENGQLERKYPEFNHLMDEYHDGILLFNIMENNIWSKAVSDTAGLKLFHRNHEKDYYWKERADVSIYTIKNEAYLALTTQLGKKRATKNWSANEFVKLVCPGDTIACIEVKDQKYERDEPVPFGGFTWKRGFTKTVRQAGIIRVIVVNDLIPAMPKTFHEIRGQVTADYQNYLDRQWIETLRAKYPVSINQEVLKNIQ